MVQQTTTVGGITYSYDTRYTSTSEVKGITSAYTSTILTIPKTFYTGGKTYNVTTIGSNAFKNNTNITEVNINGGDTYGNTNQIMSSAFEGCTSLTTVRLSWSVTNIGSKAFKGCTALTKVIASDGAGTTGDYKTYIPNIKTYNSEVFASCSKLDIKFRPDCNTTTISNLAFAGCSSLSLTSLPNSITSIAISAFQGCTSMHLQSLPTSIQSIGDYAFQGVTLPTDLIIPDNTKGYLSKYAFSNSIGIETVSVSGLFFVNGLVGAFYGCRDIYEYRVRDDSSSIYCTRNGILYEREYYAEEEFKMIVAVPPAGDYPSVFDVDDDVKYIGDLAFNHCEFLEQINLNNVEMIYGYAFEKCRNLKRIAFLRQIQFVGNNIFDDTGLEEVLDLGDNNITSGMYGIPSTADVRNNIPSFGYLGGIEGELPVERFVDSNTVPISVNDMISSVVLRLNPSMDTDTLYTITDGLVGIINAYGGDVSDCTTIGEFFCRIIKTLDPDYNITDTDSITDMLIALIEVYHNP